MISAGNLLPHELFIDTDALVTTSSLRKSSKERMNDDKQIVKLVNV